MKVIAWTIIGVVAVVALLVVGILAGHVGGIAIRKQGAEANPLQLQLSEPVLRGVPVMVRWVSNEDIEATSISFTWRDGSRDYPLGEAELSDLETTLTFPCEGIDSAGSLVVRSIVDQRVLGTRSVELGAPGPECI